MKQKLKNQLLKTRNYSASTKQQTPTKKTDSQKKGIIIIVSTIPRAIVLFNFNLKKQNHGAGRKQQSQSPDECEKPLRSFASISRSFAVEITITRRA